jgi:hypothetical protein
VPTRWYPNTASDLATVRLAGAHKGDVVVIAGSDKTARRRVGRRRRQGSSAATVGPALRDARERLELTVAELHDRTGVTPLHLEALEEGDLGRFPDERTALVAARRYAEVVGLDGDETARTVANMWQEVAVGGAPPRSEPPAGPATSAPTPVGHLSRYPGDGSHLRAFTQTDQVPLVARPGGGGRGAPRRAAAPLRFDATDAHPVTLHFPDEPRQAPLALRVAVWCTAVLLVVGVAGVAVHHWRPRWLATIHLVAAATTPAARTATHPHAHTTPVATVTETMSGPGAATMTVRASQYQVVMATQGPCWVRVSDPLSFLPVFSATVPAGTVKTFASGAGALSVELGASRVSLQILVHGKTVPGWSFSPASAPFVVNFRSATT